MFGQSSRTLVDDGSLEGSIPQTLMLMNGNFQGLMAGRGSALMKVVENKTSLEEKIEELYMGFYSRKPTALESARIRQALRGRISLENLTWVLFNTPEFMFIQ